MKNILLLITSTIVLSNCGFCQCPEGGMKFQGPICEKPTSAAVKEVTCSSLEVKWKGSKNQTYIVEASYHDPSTNGEMLKVAVADIAIECNGISSCTATIPVKEGTKVNWSVQAKCKNGIYSDTLRGSEVTIPSCNPLSETIHVYPNPTTGNLTVEYLGINQGTVHFMVYDMQGKMVFSRIEQAQAGINTSYKFDLAALAPGIYLLEARNGVEVKTVKFMID